MRRLAGVAAALLVGACAEGPSGASGDDEPVVFEADAFVLDEPDREPVMCLGAIADSLPPQCQGVPIVGWCWATVEGEETASGEPAGGWAATDPSRATEDHMLGLMHAMEAEPDFAGFWIDYVEEPVGEVVAEPGGIIANVAFTGDLERHRAEIRERWGGPLCLVEHEHKYDELRRIQRELGEGVAGELGLKGTWSSVDIQANVVELGVIVADDAAISAVEARYGEGTVRLFPELLPVEL